MAKRRREKLEVLLHKRDCSTILRTRLVPRISITVKKPNKQIPNATVSELPEQ